MPKIKIELPFEVLNELARIANQQNESVHVTISKILCEHVRRTTTRAVDAPCAECGGEFLHKEGCSQELSFYETAHH